MENKDRALQVKLLKKHKQEAIEYIGNLSQEDYPVRCAILEETLVSAYAMFKTCEEIIMQNGFLMWTDKDYTGKSPYLTIREKHMELIKGAVNEMGLSAKGKKDLYKDLGKNDQAVNAMSAKEELLKSRRAKDEDGG